MNIINIELPALSERKDDIEILSGHFIDKYVKNNGLTAKTLTPEAIEKMNSYSWPGNVRELENVLHRAVLMSDGDYIKPDDIYIVEKKENSSEALGQQTGSAAEKQMVFNTLGYCLGDMSKAANILGVSIDILREKLEKFTQK